MMPRDASQNSYEKVTQKAAVGDSKVSSKLKGRGENPRLIEYSWYLHTEKYFPILTK